ncbi:MAG: GNAT family N-acetyltransferase [Candidatus Merdivicinus sp.]|jgi:GNAT superfamily N-acetyltransferase
MLDFAQPEDLDALKALWLACFGGPAEYLDFYYSRRFVPGDTLVWREEGRPVSMMTLMRVRRGGEDGVYIYAVATLPEYRGRGLMRRLDAWSQEIAWKRGCRFSVLVPAEPELFAMYEKLGYRADFPIWVKEIRGPAKAPGRFSACSFAEFRELRRRFLFHIPGAVLHPDGELRYIYDELHTFSGEVLRYEEQGRPCYVAFTQEERGLLIRETIGSDPVKTAKELLLRYGAERALVRYFRPARGFRETPFGMGRRLDGGSLSRGYMALMLD